MVNVNRKMDFEMVQRTIDGMLDERDSIMEKCGSIEPLEVAALMDIGRRLVMFAAIIAVCYCNPIFLKEAERANSEGFDILGYASQAQNYLTIDEPTFCSEHFG